MNYQHGILQAVKEINEMNICLQISPYLYTDPSTILCFIRSLIRLLIYFIFFIHPVLSQFVITVFTKTRFRLTCGAAVCTCRARVLDNVKTLFPGG